MVQRKHRKIVYIISIILITFNSFLGCSSSKPKEINNNIVVAQKEQDKINLEQEEKEKAELKLKQETERKAQEEDKQKLEEEQKAKKEAEEKLKREKEVNTKLESQAKSQRTLSQNTTNAESQRKSITVYITKTGEKYHQDGCKYLKKSRIAISLENGKKTYSPCSVCSPPR